MDVILLEKVPNLGELGNIVRVKKGYGRNYLIPTGKAKRATQEAIAQFEARRAELEKLSAEKLANAQALASKLQTFVVQLVEKAAVDGRLFGSVTNHTISASLTESGLTVTRSQIQMPNGAIKIAGEHQVTVSLHPDVAVQLKIVVAGDTA